jgi:hypothetical protein
METITQKADRWILKIPIFTLGIGGLGIFLGWSVGETLIPYSIITSILFGGFFGFIAGSLGWMLDSSFARSSQKQGNSKVSA